MLNIVINGTGMMAQKVASLLAAEENLQFIGYTTEYQNEVGASTLAEKMKEMQVDAVIDFSHPAQLTAILTVCAEKQTPLLLATTGYTERQLEEIAVASESIPVLQTYNTSIGIAAVEHAIAMLAKELQGYETEIIEIHHNKKIDAPSGTAIKLKGAVLSGRGVEACEIVMDRSLHKRNSTAEIGMQSLRLGNVYGEHSVYFAKGDEIIEVKHTALSKDLFAKGAVDLISKLIAKPNGLYTMQDFI